MNIADKILRVILPKPPFFIAWASGGSLRQARKDTWADLDAVTLQAGTDMGSDVYMSVGGFETGAPNRTAAYARRFKSVAFDIDIHPSGLTNKKPCYKTKAEGAKALFALCDAHKVPRPTVMLDSGRGVHAYWVLPSEVTVAEWAPVALKVKEWLRTDAKLAVDLTRVADAAGIMRLPGSWNTRSGTQVELLQIEGADASTMQTVGIQVMLEALQGVQTVTTTRVVGQFLPKYYDADTFGLGPIMCNPAKFKYGEVLSDMDHVFATCAVAAAAVTHPDRDRYGQYSALLKLCSHDADPEAGRKRMHELMADSPKYNAAELNRDFDSYLSMNTSACNCVSFSRAFDDTRSLCKGCPVFDRYPTGGTPTRIKSVQASIDAAAKNSAAALMSLTVEPDSESPNYDYWVDSAAAGIKLDATLLDDGVRMGVLYTKDLATIKISTEPTEPGMPPKRTRTTLLDNVFVWLTSRINSPGDKFPTQLIMWVARGDLASFQVKRVVVHQADLADKTKLMRKLFNVGVMQANPNKQQQIVNYLIHEAHRLRPGADEVDGVETSGWLNSANGSPVFNMAGLNVLAGSAPEPCVYIGGHADLLSSATVCGTKADALKVLSVYNTFATPEAKFSLLVALASPLLHMTGVKGIVYALVGGGGNGKTTLLQMMMSLWGYAEAEQLLARDTANAVSDAMTALRHVPAGLDEMTQINDVDALTSIVYEITQGRTKRRLNRDGTAQGEPARRELVLCVTSNKSIAHTIEGKGLAQDAQRSRVLDVTLTERSVRQLDTDQLATLSQAVVSNRGQLGLMFAQRMVSDFARIKQAVRDEQSRLGFADAKLKRFYIALFACTTVANSVLRDISNGSWTLEDDVLTDMYTRLLRDADRTLAETTLDPLVLLTDYMYHAGAAKIVVRPQKGGKRVYSAGSADGTSSQQAKMFDATEIENSSTRFEALLRVEKLPRQPGQSERALMIIPVKNLDAYCAYRRVSLSDFMAQVGDEPQMVSGTHPREVFKEDLYEGVRAVADADPMLKAVAGTEFKVDCYKFYVPLHSRSTEQFEAGADGNVTKLRVGKFSKGST